MTNPVRLAGLREFTAGLRQVEAGMVREVRLANNEAATVIINRARPLIPLGPGHGGHARDSLKARSTRTEVRIAAGGRKYPYYPWLDFGGAVGRNRSIRRPFLRSGRYIYRALEDHADELVAAHEAAIAELAARAGLR